MTYTLIMQGLTKRQQEIIEFIENYISEKRHSPSYREIQKFFNFSSLGSVYNHIKVLKRKNILSESKGARSLSLPTKTTVLHAEIPLVGKLRGGMPIMTFPQITSLYYPLHLLPSENKPYYFLQVEGNELAEEMIQEKDLLLIEPRNHFSDGEVIVALVNEMATFLKKGYSEPPYIRLESANSQVSPIILREENVQIQGIAISLLRNYNFN